MEENNDNDDDNNNNDENYDQQQQQQQQVEQQRQADANDDDAREEEEEEKDDDITAVILKLNTILERRKQFPLRQRNKIVELAEEYIEQLEDDILVMLCDPNVGAPYYRGLDRSRDTEAEVETALRICPDVLARRRAYGGMQRDEHPIQVVSCAHGNNGTIVVCNLMNVSFVACLARVGNELKQFKEEERGGLLCEDQYGNNTIDNLVHTKYSDENEDYSQRVDTVCFTQLVQLKRVGLLKKEDIPGHLHIKYVCRQSYFAENTFRFLVDLNPTSLLYTDADDGWSLLHYAACGLIQKFRTIFECGLRYYPHKKGLLLLFQSYYDNVTPLQYACKKYGRDTVMKEIETSMTRCYSEETPFNSGDAVITAAIDDKVHLDCVFFLLRRQPDVLVKLLSGSINNNNNDTIDNRNRSDGAADGDGECEIDAGDFILNADVNVYCDANHRKRKRDL